MLLTKKMAKLATIFIFLCTFTTFSHCLPLSTSSRWIIDDKNGQRVKLACVNWAAHLQTMIPEGLDQQPINKIVKHISLMGFNCVRLTWATYMFTRYSNLTVAQSFAINGLHDALTKIAQKNPQLLGLSVFEAQRAVIEEMGRHGIMSILDNHLSRPMWCCGNHDGNGFWVDEDFQPKEWLKGLDIVAKKYKYLPMVIGISLRNELRGPLQNQSVWYKNVKKGAKTIHKANPNILIIISGLNYDIDFTFLKRKHLNLLNMRNKIIYEIHRYAFTEGQANWFLTQPLNKVCDTIKKEIMDKSGFLLKGKNAAPLFVSEFGADQKGMNPSGNLFMGCLLTFLVDLDLDWAVWALQGNYYTRQGKPDMDEPFGMFNNIWNSLRSPQYHAKLQLIQQKLQDPKSKKPKYYLLFHPQSGKCLNVATNNVVEASSCIGASRWIYHGDGTSIRLTGTSSCLTTSKEGMPLTLSKDCTNNEKSRWQLASNYQLSNVDENGKELCLDFDTNSSFNKVLVRKCVGLDGKSIDNPQSQWFKLVSTNVY
ncbi:glycosyl hydrolase 5 family protein-like [Solanum pennellii]|uniref:Glycosyl hydrolase 5 family protein-like n=1 Tax=Solanum pennellii TaxID=28526 RepID=A0ABM1VFQ3_SOLPN|nr:glycosyl hydrolase 5 family protein-like [Solanum pennellii]